MIDKHLKEARKWLGFLREGTAQYDRYIILLRGEVRSGGISLAYIEMSEEEFDEFRIKGCAKIVQPWLNQLREGTTQNDLIISFIREEAKKSGFPLVYLGTSEKELASFAQAQI